MKLYLLQNIRLSKFGVFINILKKKAIIPFLLSLFFLACQEKSKIRQVQLHYQVTVSAPEGYPVEVHIGFLSDEKKQLICGVPKTGITQGGWQNDGSAGGQSGSVIPSFIDLTYVAYAEKKFYRVQAALPKAKKF